ncbi:hypothetical protein OAA06_00350 [bacterium]|nr:hypothetical protein [bacterium]
MELKHLKISELEEFVQSNEFLKGDLIPISPVRALSQIKNPKAKSDDVVLTIAYDKNLSILGYIGALPDKIENVRCAWNSCWWVKNGAPAEVSMKLLFSFISNWDKKILLSEMTPLTNSIIEKLGFCKHKTTTGFRGYTRFTLATVLPRKKPRLSKQKFALILTDSLLNVLVSTVNIFRCKSSVKGVDIKEIELTEEYDSFILKHSTNLVTKRKSIDFNWIQQNSWLVHDTDKNPLVSKKYFFSYAVNRHKSQWVSFTEKEELKALVYYAIKDNELKLPYVFCEESSETFIGDYFYSMLLKNNSLATITTFHPKLSAYLKNNKRFIFRTLLPKYSAISNELLNETKLIEPKFQMGDGDCVFT